MARVNFPGNPISKPDIHFGDPHLQIAVSGGHAIALQLDVLAADQTDGVVDTPHRARRLRLYLAAVEGELDNAMHMVQAEIIVGIRNADGSLKEEWK